MESPPQSKGIAGFIGRAFAITGAGHRPTKRHRSHPPVLLECGHDAKDRSQWSLPLRQRQKVQALLPGKGPGCRACPARRQARRVSDPARAAPREYDNLDDDSNAVLDLIRAGKLDEAERAARELLVRYPEVIDGFDRLGMLHEARGQNREAADCYRKVLDMVLANPRNHDPEYPALWRSRIAKLDPPPTSE
jgi:tetratricopeptide (TPR) repeat protein